MTGYSGTPLEKKLGIRDNFRVRLINIPGNYFELFSVFPLKIQISEDPAVKKNFIHFFARSRDELYSVLPLLKSEIEKDGMIWVSWPKKSSGVRSDITEDMNRKYALDLRLVDVKVCSVDEVWSGLKLVIPLSFR